MSTLSVPSSPFSHLKKQAKRFVHGQAPSIQLHLSGKRWHAFFLHALLFKISLEEWVSYLSLHWQGIIKKQGWEKFLWRSMRYKNTEHLIHWFLPLVVTYVNSFMGREPQSKPCFPKREFPKPMCSRMKEAWPYGNYPRSPPSMLCRIADCSVSKW